MNAQITNNFFLLDENNEQIDQNFFTLNTWRQSSTNIQKLVIGNFIQDNGNLISYASFCHKYNVQLTPNEFLRIKHSLRSTIQKGKKSLIFPLSLLLPFLIILKIRPKIIENFFIPRPCVYIIVDPWNLDIHGLIWSLIKAGK